MTTRLMRSRSDSMLGGVCGGLGKYLNIDSTLVRLFFLIFTLAGGAGVLIYLILWIILPRDDMDFIAGMPNTGQEFKERAGQIRDEFNEAIRKPNASAPKLIGIALIVTGGFLFLRQLNIPWLNWLHGDIIWPILLVLGGAALLIRAVRGG